jgi:hypothetical protein
MAKQNGILRKARAEALLQALGKYGACLDDMFLKHMRECGMYPAQVDAAIEDLAAEGKVQVLTEDGKLCVKVRRDATPQ